MYYLKNADVVSVKLHKCPLNFFNGFLLRVTNRNYSGKNV